MTQDAEGETSSLTPTWIAATDLASLISFAARLPDDLVKTWSRALSAPQMQEALEEVRARHQALLTAYQATLAAADEKRGRPVLLPQIPPTTEFLNAVLDDQGDDEHFVQTITAEMVVFGAALSLIRWTQEPGMTVTHLPSGEQEHFWDTGAFTSLRDQFRLVRRVHDQAESLDQGTPVPPTWMDMLDCAVRASSAGLPEAALLYLRLSLPGLNETLLRAESGRDAETDVSSGTATAAPKADSPEVPLAQELRPFGRAIEGMNALCESWARGNQGNLGAAVLLADGLITHFRSAMSRRLFGVGLTNADEVNGDSVEPRGGTSTDESASGDDPA